jgi:hypothetical protein
VESTVAVATIVAKNYLSFARVLGESFRRHHPGVPFYALLTDEVDGYFDPAAEPFSIVGLSDLRIPDLHRFRFHYARKEVAVAVKPYLLSHPVPFHRSGTGRRPSSPPAGLSSPRRSAPT